MAGRYLQACGDDGNDRPTMFEPSLELAGEADCLIGEPAAIGPHAKEADQQQARAGAFVSAGAEHPGGGMALLDDGLDGGRALAVQPTGNALALEPVEVPLGIVIRIDLVGELEWVEGATAALTLHGGALHAEARAGLPKTTGSQ